MTTEHALVKALQEWGFDRMESIHIVGVVRAALPEGTVLTRDGVAKLGIVGAEHCPVHEDDCSWHRFKGCNPVPLFTLTPVEDR